MRRGRAVAIVQQLVDMALAALGAVHQQVFQFRQPGEVQLQLRVAPARRLAQLAAGEADFCPSDRLRRDTLGHQAGDQPE